MDIRFGPLIASIAFALPAAVLAQETPPLAGEPQVRHVVIEDDGARIDELRVRGVTTRITVRPKNGGKLAYEIIPLDPSSRDIPYGPQGSRGASGKRVWNVLSF